MFVEAAALGFKTQYRAHADGFVGKVGRGHIESRSWRLTCSDNATTSLGTQSSESALAQGVLPGAQLGRTAEKYKAACVLLGAQLGAS